MTKPQTHLEPGLLLRAPVGSFRATQHLFCTSWGCWWHLWSLSMLHLTALCLHCINLETLYAKRALSSLQLSRECRAEVQRILHQRAMDVKLDPALQDKCMIDLGKWCSEKTETGQVLYTVTLLLHLQSWRGWKDKKGVERHFVVSWLFIAESILKRHAVWNIYTRLRDRVNMKKLCISCMVSASNV